MNKWFDYIKVFIAVVVADIVWAAYITQVSNKNAWWAAWCSVLVYLTGAYAVTKYVEDKKMLIPAVFGAFLGTYIVVYFTP
jgi:hypothetical protein